MRYSWKKTLAMVGIITATTIGSTFAQNQNLRDWLKGLTDQIPFGYKNPDDIVTIKEITADKLVLESSIIKGELGENILNYTVMYGQSPLSDILENASLLETTKEKQFTFTDTITNPFTMEVTATGDSIDPTKIYYVSIIPRDLNGVMGEISEELCFQLSTGIKGKGKECTTATAQTMNAAPDMALSNITHTQNGSTIRLQWTALQGADRIDLFLYDDASQNFNRLATVGMSDENYSFTVTRDGEHSVKFTPLDGNGQPIGKEKIYTFTVTGLTPAPQPDPQPQPQPQPTPEIKEVPKVGPTENIALVVGLTVLLYVGYRVFRKKRA